MITDNNDPRRTSEKAILAAELFEAISHPTRIQILKDLENKALGFAKLKSSLGFSSSGNLSHHLNKLGALVQTNDRGDYELTDQGCEALIAFEAFGILDKHWISNVNALILGLLFYSAWLTVGIILVIFGGIGDPLSTLVGGLVGAIIFYVVMKRNIQNPFR